MSGDNKPSICESSSVPHVEAWVSHALEMSERPFRLRLNVRSSTRTAMTIPAAKKLRVDSNAWRERSPLSSAGPRSSWLALIRTASTDCLTFSSSNGVTDRYQSDVLVSEAKFSFDTIKLVVEISSPMSVAFAISENFSELIWTWYPSMASDSVCSHSISILSPLIHETTRPSTLGRLFPLLAKPSSMDCTEAVTRSLTMAFPAKSTGTTATHTVNCGVTSKPPASWEMVSGKFGDLSVTNVGEPLPTLVNLNGAAYTWYSKISLAEDNSNSRLTAEPSSSGRSRKVRFSIRSGATSSWKLLIGITLGFSNSVR